MATRVIEYRAQCRACKGTGIYVGLAEHSGAGVVCHRCKGSGAINVRTTYEDFEGRVPREDVIRVLAANPGISVGSSPDEEGRSLRLEDFGGMTYTKWAAGHPFPTHSEMRAFTCPAWWYQCTNDKKKPHWDECIGMGTFTGCAHFGAKAACWVRWDEEFDA